MNRRRLVYAVDLGSDYGDTSPEMLSCAIRSHRHQICVAATTTGSRKRTIDAETLAHNWGIGLQAARQTIKVTTQRGIRSIANPSLSRRFRTNDCNMRYRRLRADVFSDTLIANVVSRRQNKYAQAFCTSFGWTRCFPMKQKSDAHEALSTVFARDGVPNAIIIDGSMEQTAGLFCKKAMDADCHIRQTEPHSPWSNATEGAVRELK